MTEKPAKGVRGFLLMDFFSKKHFFRVYDEQHNFTDYDIAIEDLEIEILADSASLYEGDTNKIAWSQAVLKGKPGERVTRVTRKKGARIVVHGHLNEKLEFVPDETPPIQSETQDD